MGICVAEQQQKLQYNKIQFHTNGWTSAAAAAATSPAATQKAAAADGPMGNQRPQANEGTDNRLDPFKNCIPIAG